MADYTIFYSWQTDSPETVNRRFIRDALDAAVLEIAEHEIQVADIPRVVSGMENVAGSPEVASMMFLQIENAGIFVGDTTLVGEICDADGEVAKRVPNPNVSLEMGYAAGVLGWSRIICVMNEYQFTRYDQPFDTRNRRFPIDYCLSPEMEAIPATRMKVFNDLKKWLRKAILTVDKSELARIDVAIKSLDVRCLELMGLYGSAGSFPEPKGHPHLLIDLDKFNAAAVRLLELHLLKADVDPKQGLYAYHWTYLGKKVLRSLQIIP
jgi:hypothetical protein